MNPRHVALLLTAVLAACSGGGPAQPACIVHSQCPLGVCVAGRCSGATPCADDSPCERRTRCVERRCIPVCDTDVDCPAGHVCTPDGCREFSDKRVGVPPVDRAAARAPLRAGVAEALLDVPVGVSLGGYASRGGIYNGPYAETILPSVGFFHRLRIRAIALDTGNERVVIANAPLIFMTDYLRERVVRRILDATGVNYRDHLILATTHTHSGPARIWTLPVGFGAFGLDEHMDEIHERVAASFERAILDAVARLAPAKMGWALDEDFDRDDKITSDRREESPPFEDHRLFLLRVDDAQDRPLAAIINFGVHGTNHEGPYLNDDALAGPAFKTEEALEAVYGRRVPVLFINGNAGTMSPRCDDTGLPDQPRSELCGIRTVPYAMALWNRITTKSAWDMRFALKRVPVSRKDIGYGDHEFYDENPIGGLSPFLYGAFQCLLFNSEFPAHDGQLGCVLPIEVTFRAPLQVFSKAVLSALRLDDLVLITEPGEPGMEWGAGVVARAKTIPGVREAVLWGYAQDHHLYILEEADWYYGGLETQTSIWGPKFGPYLARETQTLLEDLLAGRTPVSRVMPQDFVDFPGPDPVVPDTTPASDVGTFVEPVPLTVERLAQIRFTWVGGHPGAGTPRVVLQREVAGSYVDLASDGTPLTPGRTPYDNDTYKFITDHRLDGGRHLWSIRWEELRDFPTGRYRFRIEAPYWDGQAARTKEVLTGAFDLVPTPALTVHGATVSAAGVSLRALYPPGIQVLEPRERFARDQALDRDCDGQTDATMDVTADYRPAGIRVRDPAVGPVEPIAVRGRLRVTVARQGESSQVFDDVAPAAGSDGPVVVPLRDGRGPVTASPRFPELVGQTVDHVRCMTVQAPRYEVASGFSFGGAGTYTVRVQDAAGNYGETTVVVP